MPSIAAKENVKRSLVPLGCFALLLSLWGVASLRPAHSEEAGPTLNKASLRIFDRRYERYWKAPDDKEPVYNAWSWVPRVNFDVNGPISAGSQMLVDITLPDGKLWMELPCETPETKAGDVASFDTPVDNSDRGEKKAVIATGAFGIKIHLKNELESSDTTLFTGKFKVVKFHKGTELPQFKNQFEYVVDHDWLLPLGYLWLDKQFDENVPRLMVSMWFKGEAETGQVAAYLFHGGKEIASTKDQGGSVGENGILTTAGMDTGDPKWQRFDFGWNLVRGYNHDTVSANNYDSSFFLDKNPGDYEIKVLRNGKLARDLKFTVGTDGQIVDNGLVQKNKLGTQRMLVPAAVLGETDGKWNAVAWKTDAFYGNPPVGFSPPEPATP